jgi:curved DNA-binding protein CbpA
MSPIFTDGPKRGRRDPSKAMARSKRRAADAAAPESPYKVLGISASATADEIRAAWKKMALKVHPDKCEDDGGVAFQAVQAAYETLRALVPPSISKGPPPRTGGYDASRTSTPIFAGDHAARQQQYQQRMRAWAAREAAKKQEYEWQRPETWADKQQQRHDERMRARYAAFQQQKEAREEEAKRVAQEQAERKAEEEAALFAMSAAEQQRREEEGQQQQQKRKPPRRRTQPQQPQRRPSKQVERPACGSPATNSARSSEEGSSSSSSARGTAAPSAAVAPPATAAAPPAAAHPDRYYSTRWHPFFHTDAQCRSLLGVREARLREALGISKQLVESVHVPRGLEPCSICVGPRFGQCSPQGKPTSHERSGDGGRAARAEELAATGDGSTDLCDGQVATEGDGAETDDMDAADLDIAGDGDPEPSPSRAFAVKCDGRVGEGLGAIACGKQLRGGNVVFHRLGGCPGGGGDFCSKCHARFSFAERRTCRRTTAAERVREEFARVGRCEEAAAEVTGRAAGGDHHAAAAAAAAAAPPPDGGVRAIPDSAWSYRDMYEA